jgi:hypothetical protein
MGIFVIAAPDINYKDCGMKNASGDSGASASVRLPIPAAAGALRTRAAGAPRYWPRRRPGSVLRPRDRRPG